MQTLIEKLKNEGYTEIKEVQYRGLCGLRRFMFTTGLCYGMDENTFIGRYCFQNYADAKDALSTWDGKSDPEGDWIKHKGRVEYSNPIATDKTRNIY